jgi:hypothetical protein
VEIRYKPRYAYEEVLACFADLPHLSGSFLSSAEELATIITGKPTEMMRLGDQERAVVLQQYARKPYIVVVADEFITGLSTKEQLWARRLFTRLVQASPTKGGATPDVPSAVPVKDLPTDLLSMLDKALTAKLVKTTETSDDRSLSLADDRLVSAWPRYREWIDRDREFLVWRQRFVRERLTWESSDLRPDDLLTGTSLNEATKWLGAYSEDLTEREIAFIEASKKADADVRRAATEEATSPALARRLQSVDWDERKRFEQERSRELEAARKTYFRRFVGLGVAAFLVLCIAAGLFFWLHRKQVLQTQVSGSVEQSPIPPLDATNSSGGSDIELRHQLANTLVGLGIVSSAKAGTEMTPLDGILAIDKLIANSSSPRSKVAIAEASRMAFLKSAQPLFASSPELKSYVCSHNAYVIAARSGIANATSEASRWSKEYPLAQVTPQKADDPNSVPIVVTFLYDLR